MTLVEMAVACILFGILLFALSGWMTSLRADLKHELAVRLMSDLDQALARYHRTTGCYPQHRGSDSAISATLDLLDHERNRQTFEALPDSLFRGPGRRNLIDPWGTPLRYYDSPRQSPFVRSNSGRPLFVCAGPDRDFGDRDPGRIGDNLRSDDPGPAGFRLHDVLRGPMSETEKEVGEAKD